ncbi:hypothetical protein [Runella sp.]|jgi:hypothetical protein|uniref:hypothetical protein n=1 Tax=Runella sp. TaxID=1960881 RepID=UPI00261AD42D|nr:hypothetical protein [Runella sp.]
MKKNLKSLYQSAVIITDSSLNGKINRIELTPEHQAMHDKLAEAYQRVKAKKQ